MDLATMCQNSSCGKAAAVICLRSGSEKRKLCKEHSSNLLDKGYVIMNIEADGIVSSIGDEPLYRERKSLKEKGIGNVIVLEAAYNKELREALELLEAEKGKMLNTVEARFHEMKLALENKSEEIKKHLADLQRNYNGLLASKDAELSPLAQLACKDLTTTPKFFRFAVTSVSDEVSKVLFQSWKISAGDVESCLQCLDPSQRSSVVTRLWEEAASQAKAGFLEALQLADSMAEDPALFPQQREAVQVELLKREKARLQASIEWLAPALNIRQQSRVIDRETMSIGFKLADLYSVHLGEYSKAQEVLTYFYDNRQQLLSADSVRLWGAIISLYFAHAQFEDTYSQGLSVLQNVEPSMESVEQYLTTSFYVIYSMLLQNKKEEANALLESFKNRDPRKESCFAKMLRILICGIADYYTEEQREALGLLSQARQIGASHFPTSPFTALSLFFLASLSEEGTREQYYKQARAIFEVSAPKSIQAANNLCNLGLRLNELKKWFDEEECYKQAQAIYEVAAPGSIEAAVNCHNLGNLFYDTMRWNEAEEYYQRTQAVMQVVDPNSTLAAEDFIRLGSLHLNMKRLGDAERCYQQAEGILENAAPESVAAASNKWSMGELFGAMNRIPEAIRCFEEAARLLAINNMTDQKIQAEERIASLRQLSP